MMRLEPVYHIILRRDFVPVVVISRQKVEAELPVMLWNPLTQRLVLVLKDAMQVALTKVPRPFVAFLNRRRPPKVVVLEVDPHENVLRSYPVSVQRII